MEDVLLNTSLLVHKGKKNINKNKLYRVGHFPKKNPTLPEVQHSWTCQSETGRSTNVDKCFLGGKAGNSVLLY